MICMEMDRNGLEVIAEPECLALLASVPVARVAVSINALPVIFPVNIVLTEGEVVFRTAVGSKLDAAVSQAVVAVEADSYDSIGHVGWSVLVRGVSRVVVDEQELGIMRRLPLRPWANECSDRFVAVSTDIVSGRRIHSWYTQAGGADPMAAHL